jgi:Icc-related predicted phosphoesterase
MKFLATSDLHGWLPQIKEEFDLLMICRDVCPDMYGVEYSQIDWFGGVFIPWINNLPFKHAYSKVIFVPGNHDKCFDGIVSKAQMMEWEFMTLGRLKILNHDMYDFEYPVSDGTDVLRIFGTPYCTQFGNWAFMVDDNELERKYSQIPSDIDILLSHDSPNIEKLGAVLDEESRFYNPSAGNAILADHIWRINPKIFHSGHMHSGNHNFILKDGVWMANVSLVDESINPSNDILSYDFDEENKKVVQDLVF